MSTSRLMPRLLAGAAALAFSVLPAVAQYAPPMDAPQPPPDQAAADNPGLQGSYGYYRIVQGSANVVSQGSTAAAQENQPVITGDRLWTNAGSRVEAVLPDGTRARVAGETQLGFDQLVGAADNAADATLLTLDQGELQLVTDGNSEVRVDTANATVDIREAGSYRMQVRGGSTELVVRNGSAELRTPDGNRTVNAGEATWLQGDAYAGAELADAGGLDALESWGTSLEQSYRSASYGDEVDPSLTYASARMDGYGGWTDVDGQRCWRPRVTVDWSPYRDGRWGYTPSGLTWISYEPWGWVPYHYGSWDYRPSYGWCWFPGRVFAPAWVYWYWGPSLVGWCPIGYYSHFYAGFGGRDWDGFGFRFGVHGWAGGSLGFWHHWNFIDNDRLEDHRLARYTRSGEDLAKRMRELPRGIIATDTRGLRPGVATRPHEGMRWLQQREGARGTRLPDLTRFVARDPHLRADVARIALPIDRTRTPSSGLYGGRGRGGAEASGRGGQELGRGSGRLPAARGLGGRPRGSSDSGSWRGDRGSVSPGGYGRQGFLPQPRPVAPRDPGLGARPRSGWRDGGTPAVPGPGHSNGGPRSRPPQETGNDGWRGAGHGSVMVRPYRPQADRGAPGASPYGAAPSGVRGWRGGDPAPRPGDPRPPVRRIIEGTRAPRAEPPSAGGYSRPPANGWARGGAGRPAMPPPSRQYDRPRPPAGGYSQPSWQRPAPGQPFAPARSGRSADPPRGTSGRGGGGSRGGGSHGGDRNGGGGGNGHRRGPGG